MSYYSKHVHQNVFKRNSLPEDFYVALLCLYHATSCIISHYSVLDMFGLQAVIKP